MHSTDFSHELLSFLAQWQEGPDQALLPRMTVQWEVSVPLGHWHQAVHCQLCLNH